jgi:hypothetical protein
MMIPADVRTAVVLRPQTNRSLPFDFRLKAECPFGETKKLYHEFACIATDWRL